MIESLKSDIETALKRRMRTPKDFDFLSECIFQRLSIMLSATTLKRIWGYLDEKVAPRESTLDILSQLVGYRDWGEYKSHYQEQAERESNHVLSRRLSVSDDLTTGDILHLTWRPNRICKVEHLGMCRFRVIESENTRLKPGDTFDCRLIIEGEPLFIDNLCQENLKPSAYVCGKKSGIRFSRIN